MTTTDTADRVTSSAQIPHARFYVSATDLFMSGWGMAEGLTNRLIFLCDTFDEARYVEDRLMLRSEMKYINVSGSKPRVSRHWYAQVKTRDTSPSFYPNPVAAE